MRSGSVATFNLKKYIFIPFSSRNSTNAASKLLQLCDGRITRSLCRHQRGVCGARQHRVAKSQCAKQVHVRDFAALSTNHLQSLFQSCLVQIGLLLKLRILFETLIFAVPPYPCCSAGVPLSIRMSSSQLTQIQKAARARWSMRCCNCDSVTGWN